MIDIQIDEGFLEFVDETRVRAVAQSALYACHLVNDIDVSVVITTTDAVYQLNKQYRGVDAPTDVLSFPAAGQDEADPFLPAGELAPCLGDIIIAFPVAQAQALAAGHTPVEEVLLLTVHGLLHLAGYDHDTPERKAAMWQVQNNVLAQHGLSHVTPTEAAH